MYFIKKTLVLYFLVLNFKSDNYKILVSAYEGCHLCEISRSVSRRLTVLYRNVHSFLSKLSWLLRVHFSPFCQTYIGSILCAVNPYYVIEGLYERSVMATYRGKHIGELPPHVFAIANECYYSMWKKGESQCVLIRYGQYLIVMIVIIT